MLETKVWIEKVTIPTYGIGEPDKNPHFLEQRVYQGSSGVVYPHNVIEKINDTKEDVEWTGVFLENDYIKVMIMPQLGGRIQMAFDKTANRHFVYYNQVIKPALVGLAGPWISGGIEFNWPQHHRPSTYDSVDHTIEEHENGAKTIWVGETEKMFRTRGLIGFTVHPDKSYIEITGKVYNGTNLPQTFLWWANPAVKADGGHQSIFPPDVNAVFDHGKRDVSEFPIAKGFYYKADYTSGVDISKYENIPVPTSYMAHKSNYDFVGAYVHEENGGLLHVADHNIAPGKKQWTWGNGDFGQAWDRQLTDEDGPYIELMTGVYTDNQPDFTWLEPYEEKVFTQYFMPYRDLAVIKNANKNIAIRSDISEGKASLGIYTTSEMKDLKVVVSLGSEIVFQEQNINTSPAQTWLKDIKLNVEDELDYNISVYNNLDEKIIDWTPDDMSGEEIPEAAKSPSLPKDVEYIDELIIIGTHIEQYRNAIARAEDYYLEAIKRDPLHSQANVAMGRLMFRKGQFKEAEEYIDNALKRLTSRNAQPFDGEAYYLKGLARLYQNDLTLAYKYFYKSTWNGSFAAKGFFEVARIDTTNGNYEKALEFVNKSLANNGSNHKAKHLNVLVLRLLNNNEEALKMIKKYLSEDALELAIMIEKWLITNSEEDKKRVVTFTRLNETTLLEIACDYMRAGQFKSAIKVLELTGQYEDALVPYYLSFLYTKIGNNEKSETYCDLGDSLPDVGIFANKIDDVEILEFVVSEFKSAKAMYLLGNLFYDKRIYNRAIDLWNRSIEIDPDYATTHRNMAIANFNKLKKPNEALSEIKKAIELNRNDSRLYFEYNDLLIKLGNTPDKRRTIFDSNLNIIMERDDLVMEYSRLLNMSKEFEKANELLNTHKFHPWEGGEGKVTAQYTLAKIAMTIELSSLTKYEDAIKTIESALILPHNLGEGKLPTTSDNDIYYIFGQVCELSGDKNKAKELFEKATRGQTEISGAAYYNDNPVDYAFYKALAFEKLGNLDEANKIYNSLIRHGEDHIDDELSFDFFAVSLPDSMVFDADKEKAHKSHCYFLQAMGHWGMKDYDKAEALFAKVIEIDANHDKTIFMNGILLEFIKKNR